MSWKLNNFNNKVCLSHKTEDLNLIVFNMITSTNESKTLTKYIPCECKWKPCGRKCNSNEWRTNIKSWCECKHIYVWEKDYVWYPAKCNCENGKKLASIMDKIICDEIMDIKETNFNDNFY